MRYFELFPKTLRADPKDAAAINHKLLVRGGFIDQLMAGSWTLLPLGWRVVSKINQIIREEMNATGALEMLMPLMHPKEVWEETGRWESADEIMYKLKDSRGKDLALAFTHEEVVLDLVRKHVQSYLDLPIKIYHFSTKFRNEIRATGGILRGREFLMKDLYSVHANEEDFWSYYNQIKDAYSKIFQRLGLETIITEASGGVFTKNRTHEFQVLSEAGEDTIYYDPKTKLGVNKEILRSSPGAAGLREILDEKKEGYVEGKAIEVGNIFSFGTYYSEKMGVYFTDKDGTKKPVWFGSYGIGPTRVMGTLVEVFHDDRGIIWPEAVAPFKYHLIGIRGQGSGVRDQVEGIYDKLTAAGEEVLYDDRQDVSAGEKFADCDLIGCPVRLVVSDKVGDKVEVKNRKTGETSLASQEQLLRT